MTWAEKVIDNLNKMSPEGKANFVNNFLDIATIETILGINMCDVTKAEEFDCCADRGCENGCKKCKNLFLRREIEPMVAINARWK